MRYIRSNILASLERVTDRFNIVHVLLVSLLLAACSLLVQKGGMIHPECTVYLPKYLSERCLLNKLYDSKLFDQDGYQARELSYFFDFIDSKFIALSVSFGYPHFYSLTHYVFSILIGLIIWQFSVRELTLKPLLGAGMVVLFWTTPCVFFFSYFRSAKIGVALAVTVLFFVIYRILRRDLHDKEHPFPPTTWLLCFAVAWCAARFDPQGFFLVVVIFAFLSLWFSAFPSKNILKLLLAFGASIILSVLYKYQIAPMLTFHLNHYWPNFTYQQIHSQPYPVHLEQLITHPLYSYNGVSLFVDTLRFLIGNIPYNVASALLGVSILLVLLCISIRARIGRKNIKLVSVVAAGFMMSYMLICLMIVIMAIKHPQLLWPDLRRIYYWSPITSVVCMTIAFILSQLSKMRYSVKWLLFVIMIIAIGGNIYAIPQHRAVITESHLKPFYENAPRLLAALRNIKDSHYQPLPDVEQNPVYQYFRKSLGSSRK
jgi:hypothetical protein